MPTFHLLLPEDLYRELRAEARRQKKPANRLVREALTAWLAAHRREMLAREIRGYAEAVAGTIHDLDPDLAAAATDELLADEERP